MSALTGQEGASLQYAQLLVDKFVATGDVVLLGNYPQGLKNVGVFHELKHV